MLAYRYWIRYLGVTRLAIMTSKDLIRFCFFALLTSIACDHDDENAFPQEGFCVFGSYNYSSVYWKDGKMTDVDWNAMYFPGAAVSGSDVYAIGNVNDEKTYRGPVYWKNGKMFKLSNISANLTPTAIAFAGSDMYITGFEEVGEKSFPVYWKNGELQRLPGKEPYSRPTGIAVSGTDVHIVGQALNKIFDNDTILITYWKNGERMKLKPTVAHEMVEDIAVSGNDVYFAGYTYDGDRYPHAKVWKNGEVTALRALTSGSVPSQATEVEVNGSDVYLAGYSDLKAVYWKNNVITPLETGAAYRADVSGLVIVNDQPIISGRNYGDYNTGSFLWKDGHLQAPFTGTGGIFNIDCLAPSQ